MQTEIFMECKNDILAVVKNLILFLRNMVTCNLVGLCQPFFITDVLTQQL